MSEKEITTTSPISEEPPRQVVFEEALEAILFAAGHPISYATLARVFELTPGKVKELVIDYSLKYNRMETPRGVELLAYPDSCQLVTKPLYLHEIREVLGIKKSGTLSTSSMEALAIIAYNQPVTRVFVDTLRRADSSYAMNNLLDRGLIESRGRLDAPGRPMLYGTTSDFLRCFGLRDLSELPQTSEDLEQMFEKAQNTIESEQDKIDGAEQVDMFEDNAGVAEDAHEPSAEDDVHPVFDIDSDDSSAEEAPREEEDEQSDTDSESADALDMQADAPPLPDTDSMIVDDAQADDDSAEPDAEDDLLFFGDEEDSADAEE